MALSLPDQRGKSNCLLSSWCSSAIHHMNKSLWNSWSKRKNISPVKKDVARIGLQTALAFKCSWVLCASMKTFIIGFQIKLLHRKILSAWGKLYLQIWRKKPSWPLKFRNKFKKGACKNSGLTESLVMVCHRGLCRQFRKISVDTVSKKCWVTWSMEILVDHPQ